MDEKWQNFLKLGFKFGIVGIIGTFVDIGFTWFFKEKVKLNKYIANGCGFSLAVINNYLLNRYWTFTGDNQDWKAEFGRFVIFSVIGLALSTLFIRLFNDKMGIKFYYAKVLSIGCVFFWNFFINYFFNFHH